MKEKEERKSEAQRRNTNPKKPNKGASLSQSLKASEARRSLS